MEEEPVDDLAVFSSDDEIEDNELDSSLSSIQNIYSRIGHSSFSSRGNFYFWCGYNIWSESNDEFRASVYHEIKFCGGYDGKYTNADKITEFNFILSDTIPDSLCLSGACSVYCDSVDLVYMFGGYRAGETSESDCDTSDLYKFTVMSNTWSQVKPRGVKPIPSNKVVGWFHQNRVYFFGGYGIPPNSEQCSKNCCFGNSGFEQRGWNNQFFFYDIDLNEWIWPKCHEKPPPLAASASVFKNNRLYLFGGREESGRVNSLHLLDMTTMRWSMAKKQAHWPEPRSWHSFNLCDINSAVLFGGLSQDGHVLNDCWILSLDSLTWTEITRPGLEPRMWHQSMYYDGILFVHGGSVSSIMSIGDVVAATHIQKILVSPRSLFLTCLDVVIKKRKYLREGEMCELENVPREISMLFSESPGYYESFCQDH